MENQRSGTGMQGAWKRRDVKLLLVGFSVSSAGDWLYSVALIVFVFERTHSAFWVGAASILRFLPYIIFSPFAGALADRYDKRRVMIASDGGRTILMLLLAIVATTDLHVIVAILLAFLLTLVGTAYGPALSAALPHFVDEDELAGANALISAVDTTALVVGPAIGGLLLVLGSPSLAFAVNAATFLVSAVTMWLVRTPTGRREESAPTTIWQEVTDGVKAILSAREAVVVVLFAMGAAFLYGHELVLLVLVAEDRLGIGAEGVGWLDAGIGAGGLLAALLTSRLAAVRRSESIFLAAVLCSGLPLAFLALTTELSVALLFMAVIGIGAIVLDVIGTTILQRAISPDLLARIFGLLDSISVASILAGSLIAPILVTWLGLEGALAVAGCLLPAVAVLTFRLLARLTAAGATEKERIEPLLAHLRSSGIFEGATETILERLALSARPVAVTGGDTVVAEGEPADDFYLIESGSFEVLFRGDRAEPVRVNEMGAGDHFGEIGLIERIPRTATVRALTDGTLQRLDGATFVETLTTAPILPARLQSRMHRRLERTHPDLVPQLGADG